MSRIMIGIWEGDLLNVSIDAKDLPEISADTRHVVLDCMNQIVQAIIADSKLRENVWAATVQSIQEAGASETETATALDVDKEALHEPHLDCSCWCGRKVYKVPASEVKAGRTRSCGRACSEASSLTREKSSDPVAVLVPQPEDAQETR